MTGGGFPKMAKPAHRALAGAGFVRLEQLAGATEAEILGLHGMGPRSLRELRAALAKAGFWFRT
ncbi:MAG: hypothetical protein IT546_15710 [Caulobacteraceae bacterium]|nr:hypothetical protein [Caulobacteraceae bacterium]